MDFTGGPVAQNASTKKQTNKQKRNASANPGYLGSIPDLGRFHMWRSNQACVPELLKPLCI